MAFEVIIPTSAETLVVKWTPDGRALDSGAAIECDLDLIASIGLTVGGQAVAVERLLSEVDLPAVDRGVALAVFTLAGIAAHAAAASVTLPAGLLSDGVGTSPAATVTVANRSWAEDDIDALIGDGDLIYYLAKPTEGNDSTATAHTRASVGGTPSQPVGETRFATVEGLMAAVRANAPSTTVVRRRAFVLLDQTGTWTTAAGPAFFELQNTGGESVDAPLTIGTFGDGTSVPKYDASANKPFLRARRAGSVRVVGPIELDGNLTASNLILITASTSPLDIADIHLDRVWVHHAAGAGVQLLMVNDQIDAENDRVSDVTLRRCVIEDCRGDGLSVSPGGNPPGIWHFVHDYDCLFRRNGSGSGSHNRYTKRVRWSHTRRLLGGTSTGSNMKCDKHRSHLIESSIFIRKGNNFEANGDDLDGARTGREESSPGSVIKALKMRRSTITDLDTDVSQWGIKSNSAVDCELAEECIIDTVGSGPAINMLAKSGGGSGSRYNADGRRSSVAWNLIRVTGSANGCGLRFTVPDTDTPEGPGEPAADVLANHDAAWTGNILYGVAGSGALIEISNGTLADTVANGRGSLTVAGCCLYHEDGDTKTVREDGVEKSRATAVSDGIIAASNRFENPGCADATRTVERYGREVLGLTGTRLEVLTAIEDVWAEDLIQDGAVRATYSQEAIHGWMFAGAIPTALTAGNYPLGIPGPDRPVAAGRGLLALTDTDGNPFSSVVVSNAQEGVDGTLSVAVTNVSDTAVTGLGFTAGGVATVTTATPPTTLAARATTTIALSLDAGTVGAAQDWSLTVEADNADTVVLDGELTVTADAAAPDLLLTLVGGPDIGGGTVDLGEVIEETPAPWAVFARNSGNATMNGIVISATGDASLSTETEALPLSLAPGKGAIIRGVVVGAAGTVTGGLSVTYTGGSGSVSFTVASLAEAEPILELQDTDGDPAPASTDLEAGQGSSPRTTVRIANTGTGTAEGSQITLTTTGVTAIIAITDQGGRSVNRFDLANEGIVEGGHWDILLRNNAGSPGTDQAGTFGFDSPYGDGSTAYSLTVAERIGGTGDGRNLWKIRQWMESPSGHVAVINISDSNGAYQDQRWIGGVRAVYPVTHKVVAILPNTGGVGQTSGGYTQVINVGAAAIANSNFDPGGTVLGTSGLLTGLASSVNRYPRRGLKAQWVSNPTNPHFSRWCIPKMTHGGDMQTAAAVAGANYAGGEPTVGDSIVFGYACLANVNGNTWSMEMQTDIDPEGDSTWGSAVTHGYATDAAVAADDLKLLVVERAGTVNTAVGMSARLKHTATNEGARTGRQMYLMDCWFENTAVRNGLSFWSVAVGGWNTTDHLEETVDGVANTDWKYETPRCVEWLQKVVRPDAVILRVQLGQNNTAVGDFYEGSGTDIGAYRSNIEAVVARWRGICTAAGVPCRVYLVAPQNTISGGARFAALADALRAIADSSSDIKFFDLRKALIDEGYTDSNQLMLSTVSTDGIHTNQNGMYVFAQLEWGAISSARPGGGRRPRVNARKRFAAAMIDGEGD